MIYAISKVAWAVNLLLLVLLLSQSVVNAASSGTSPQDVIARLVDNASKHPIGPVENDVTDQTIKTFKAMAESPTYKDSMGSFRESIAAEYSEFSLAGPLTSLYLGGPAALFFAKVKLTADAIANHKDDTDSPGFGESGGFSVWIGPKVRDDGQIIATFCLVQQHGLWKVHGVYLSNQIIDGSSETFIVGQLAAFAKKQ